MQVNERWRLYEDNLLDRIISYCFLLFSLIIYNKVIVCLHFKDVSNVRTEMGWGVNTAANIGSDNMSCARMKQQWYLWMTYNDKQHVKDSIHSRALERYTRLKKQKKVKKKCYTSFFPLSGTPRNSHVIVWTALKLDSGQDGFGAEQTVNISQT